MASPDGTLALVIILFAWKMSHRAEELCCNSITRLEIELAMQAVHQHVVRILNFAGPDKLLILARTPSQVLQWIGTKESPL